MNGEGSRLGRAVDLVLSDVAAALGEGAVAALLVGECDEAQSDAMERTNPELLDLVTRGGGGSSADAWLYLPGEPGSTGVDDLGGLFVDLVISVAEATQELVMESRRFFGVAFPECPEHPNTPLWAKGHGADAVWACIDGGSTAIPIGGLGEGAADLIDEPRAR